MTAAVCIAIAALALLLAQEKRAQREREQTWGRERANLLLRIQAPEAAIAEQTAPDNELLFPVPFDDDEEFNKVMAERNGSA